MSQLKQEKKTPLYFDAQISQFQGIRPQPLETVATVMQAVECIRADAALKSDVEMAQKYFRQELEENQRDEKGKLLLPEYEEIKKNLPGVTWTGVFTTRKNAALVTHSGFLSFDLDFIQKKSPDVQKYDVLQEQARDAFRRLSKDEYISFLFPSVSGTGVKGLVKIPIVTSDAEYKAFFRAYQERIKTTYNLELDSLPDIARLCFLSSCKKPFINYKSALFDKQIKTQEDTPITPTNTSKSSDVSVQAAIKVLLHYGIKQELNRNEFVGVCGAFKRAGISYDIFDSIMKKTAGYDARNNFKIWNTVDPSAPCEKPLTAATLIQWACEIDKDMFKAARKDLKNPTEDVENFGMASAIEKKLSTRYSFSLNVVTDKLLVSSKADGKRPMSDYIESEIRCWLLDQGFNKRDAITDVIKNAAFKNRFHPIREYFENSKWNGEPQFERIDRYFHDRDKIFPIIFQAWCVSAVRRVYTGHHHQVLIFVGKQGRGKSYFIRWLCPLPEYHIESAINPESNDARIRLAENFIWEIGEIGSTTRRADIEALKLFISLESSVYRRAHDKYDQHKQPLASFIGTVNPDGAGFLNDPTGHRRWWPVELTSIDFSYVQHLDVNQLWAQAVQIYKDFGDSACVISDKTQEIINTNIENDFVMSDPVEELALRVFEFTGLPGDFMDTNDILCALARYGYQRGRQQADAMYVAKAMKQLTDQGVQVKKGRQQGTRGARGYVGLREK